MIKKRLAILTVGKTHSGKTTFARKLEAALSGAFVLDQDVQAEFLNQHYANLVPTEGPNVLKHSLTRLLADYAKHQTDLHVIVSNANLSRESRAVLLRDVYDTEMYTRILVYFDIPEEELIKRIHHTKRNTSIMRGDLSSFRDVLNTQSVMDAPLEDEADILFRVTHERELEDAIAAIVKLAKEIHNT